MNDIKQQIIEEIRQNVEIFKRPSQTEYIIRCPICGDSRSNPRDAHCYIKCSYDPNEPLLYYCFKCNSHGRITPWFLKKLRLKNEVIDLVSNQRYNKIMSVKNSPVDIITGSPVLDSAQVYYIEERLGKGFTAEDYDRFKIIWDMNNVYPYITSRRVKNSMPNNDSSISFLSDDKTMIMNRTFLSSEIDHQWRKIRIIPGDSKSFYTIKSTLNLFTQDQITVNIAEGIMDILSVYKNFNDGENSIFIAILGSDYISALEYAMAKGFIGYNVVIKIYIDDGINERELRSDLKKYRWIFNGIFIYKNILYKDVGVKLDQIKLIERKI